MTDRQGVEIDFCPQCRGIWLDRGELDKIIERASPAIAPAPATATAPAHSSGAPPPIPSPQRDYRRRDEDDDDDYPHLTSDGTYDSRRKKKSFLGDLFDF